ncbi:hypothetical protein B566_EDAN016639 [Ephemera danica]|nr:hypothetical protein B566_EDAN016639 [Ephemera danica]
MVEAKVQFNYKAREPDELTIVKGDIITDIKMSTGGWWEGTVRGKRGMFPDNFVKVITGNDFTVPMRQGGGRRCRVLFSYTPVNEDELELKENDVIEVLGEVEEGWWKGSLNNKASDMLIFHVELFWRKVGVFPSNFVKEEFAEDSQSGQDGVQSNDSHLEIGEAPNAAARSPSENEGPTLPPKPSKEVCRVRFSYTAVNNDELTLHVGDIITILSKHTQEAGWWKGEILGKMGVFPDNFVELLTPEEVLKLPTTSSSILSSTQTSQIKSNEADEPNQVDTKKSPRPVTTNFTTSALPPKTAPPKIDIDVADGACLSTATPTVHTSNSKVVQTNEFDKIERGAMLSHPTVSRVKAPRRRPPSAVFKEGDTFLVNGNGPEAEASATAKPTSVPLKEFEKQAAKLSWVEELRQNQARNRKTGEPLLEKKPNVILPLKPSDVRAPVVLSRSSQQLQPDVPPMSTPRRASPSTETITAVTAPSQPVASSTPSQPPITLKKPLPDCKPKKLEEEIAAERSKRVKLEKKLEKMIV